MEIKYNLNQEVYFLKLYKEEVNINIFNIHKDKFPIYNDYLHRGTIKSIHIHEDYIEFDIVKYTAYGDQHYHNIRDCYIFNSEAEAINEFHNIINKIIDSLKQLNEKFNKKVISHDSE